MSVLKKLLVVSLLFSTIIYTCSYWDIFNNEIRLTSTWTDVNNKYVIGYKVLQSGQIKVFYINNQSVLLPDYIMLEK